MNLLEKIRLPLGLITAALLALGIWMVVNVPNDDDVHLFALCRDSAHVLVSIHSGFLRERPWLHVPVSAEGLKTAAIILVLRTARAFRPSIGRGRC